MKTLHCDWNSSQDKAHRLWSTGNFLMECQLGSRCEECTSHCYFYSMGNGTCGCVSNLDKAPSNVNGFLRPGQHCGGFEEMFCSDYIMSTTSTPPVQEDDKMSWSLILGIGSGLLSAGVIGLSLYLCRNRLRNYFRERGLTLVRILEAMRNFTGIGIPLENYRRMGEDEPLLQQSEFPADGYNFTDEESGPSSKEDSVAANEKNKTDGFESETSKSDGENSAKSTEASESGKSSSDVNVHVLDDEERANEQVNEGQNVDVPSSEQVTATPSSGIPEENVGGTSSAAYSDGAGAYKGNDSPDVKVEFFDAEDGLKVEIEEPETLTRDLTGKGATAENSRVQTRSMVKALANVAQF